mmetsp:Transcript_20312/g.81919  ORF Transcript_20312/g.81919 Transcript_20312/m.81919 type:complete len:93 (+) Transcript_20312:2354-2632(+)
MSLGIPPEEIVVSTFGSPRVGNKAFRDVYSGRVTMHWSVELAPDIVPRLPQRWNHVPGPERSRKRIMSTRSHEHVLSSKGKSPSQTTAKRPA